MKEDGYTTTCVSFHAQLVGSVLKTVPVNLVNPLVVLVTDLTMTCVLNVVLLYSSSWENVKKDV
jgi:hypothetical protein